MTCREIEKSQGVLGWLEKDGEDGKKLSSRIERRGIGRGKTRRGQRPRPLSSGRNGKQKGSHSTTGWRAPLPPSRPPKVSTSLPESLHRTSTSLGSSLSDATVSSLQGRPTTTEILSTLEDSHERLLPPDFGLNVPKLRLASVKALAREEKREEGRAGRD